ncbi:enoyl-CoA hydratase-related protein [Pigmentibacter sp. JX0631]|uniref:enoyl-CoA hydratase/isomerase family protein n=1 Tax=Pigmentibacter sp. JX0631 TaxID=2976982 RepID=UPI0024698B48|nr:enoyl-CoA hydratase-related protein [Pigmentibacter sp. JX0631]WGL61523.1 enoyl-CoA hydratase-related protein [Pigmentibacter sp. JX0631]
MYDKLTELEINGKKATLKINRPNQLNALNKQVIKEIYDHCLLLKENNEVKVLVVCGAGDKAFVAGADIKEMLEFTSAKEASEFSQYAANIFGTLENLPQITIAQVQGFALGGGLELALACDLIVASEKAKFGLPEVTLGLIPGFSGTQRLAKRIGVAKTIEWISTAHKYSAQEAFQAGLLNHVTKHEELSIFTNDITDKILKNAPTALKIAKKVVKFGSVSSFKEGCLLESVEFGLLFNTPEAKEGLAAFIEKRAPNF